MDIKSIIICNRTKMYVKRENIYFRQQNCTHRKIIFINLCRKVLNFYVKYKIIEIYDIRKDIEYLILIIKLNTQSNRIFTYNLKCVKPMQEV